jgi:hypothetical protein
MRNRTDTIVFIVALAAGLVAVTAIDGGLLTSVLVGGAVAGAVAAVALVVLRGAQARRHS